ncbi:MAG: hemerythrin family protein [Magnetococcales bacterium]|nr:hemerythrin family protein [Magnetococcales bacterium]
MKKLVDVGESRFNLAHEGLLNMIIDADILLGSTVLWGRAFTSDEWENLASIFDDLIVYSKNHFSDEENYLRAGRYPNLEHHQSLHNAIITKLTDYQKKIILGDDSELKEIRTWLLEWLFIHVNAADLAYADYFSKSKDL